MKEVILVVADNQFGDVIEQRLRRCVPFLVDSDTISNLDTIVDEVESLSYKRVHTVVLISPSVDIQTVTNALDRRRVPWRILWSGAVNQGDQAEVSLTYNEDEQVWTLTIGENAIDIRGEANPPLTILADGYAGGGKVIRHASGAIAPGVMSSETIYSTSGAQFALGFVAQSQQDKCPIRIEPDVNGINVWFPTSFGIVSKNFPDITFAVAQTLTFHTCFDVVIGTVIVGGDLHVYIDNVLVTIANWNSLGYSIVGFVRNHGRTHGMTSVASMIAVDASGEFFITSVDTNPTFISLNFTELSLASLSNVLEKAIDFHAGRIALVDQGTHTLFSLKANVMGTNATLVQEFAIQNGNLTGAVAIYDPFGRGICFVVSDILHMLSSSGSYTTYDRHLPAFQSASLSGNDIVVNTGSSIEMYSLIPNYSKGRMVQYVSVPQDGVICPTQFKEAWGFFEDQRITIRTVNHEVDVIGQTRGSAEGSVTNYSSLKSMDFGAINLEGVTEPFLVQQGGNLYASSEFNDSDMQTVLGRIVFVGADNTGTYAPFNFTRR